MRILFATVFALLPFVADAADARDPRVGLSSMVNSRLAPGQNRAMVASKNQISIPDVSLNAAPMSPSIKDNDVHASIPKKDDKKDDNTDKDNRAAERAACLNNNIGIGDTFVWASRYSNTDDYALMQEDVEHPENNVCFVKVDLRSADPRINISDIPSKYFQWGNMIECGSWVDEELLKQRILDAKKKGRAWATVGGAVGGAAVGVGSMELFGNRLIGGAVEGQKDMNSDELLKSQLLTLKNNKDSQFDEFMEDLALLKEECDKLEKETLKKPSQCTTFNYDELLKLRT